MIDHELLELAAKARGGWPHYNYGTRKRDIHWNPLADDGDALRLAVDLKLGIQLLDYEAIVYIPGGGVAERITVPVDLRAATRRAIVRAAAEIARRMPDEVAA